MDGAVVATKKMDKTTPIILAWDENMDVGSEACTAVNDAVYKVQFEFTGTLDDLKLVIDGPILSDADKAKLEAAMTGN